DDWAIAQSNRLLKFFYSQGMGDYGNQYTLDGVVLEKEHSPGLVAMNAVVALAAGDPVRKEFVAELWRTPTPDGRYRYYDGLLYLMGLLQVSGNFRVYHLTGQPTTGCLD
ncbi:MAG: glycoside hydrolase, partial [Candidatus Neomarinimicrobiota bacterium]